MGELVDELEAMQYLVRRPDPTDRRAKLIMLTRKGRCIAAGIVTIEGIEAKITQTLGASGHRQLQDLLQQLIDAG